MPPTHCEGGDIENCALVIRLKDAYLIRWTKRIDAKGAFSKSLRDLLVQALQKIGINQELTVLCNNSTARLCTGLVEGLGIKTVKSGPALVRQWLRQFIMDRL